MIYDAIWAEVLGVAEVPEYSFEWPPLRPPTVEEVATQTKIAVEAGVMAVNAGLTSTAAVATGFEAAGGLDLFPWRAAVNPDDDTDAPTGPETALSNEQVQSVMSVAERVATNVIGLETGLGILRLALPNVPEALLLAALPAGPGSSAAQPATAPAPSQPDLTNEETDDDPLDEDEPPLELPDDLVSAREAADMLSISPAALGGMVRRGEIRRYRVGSAYRYSRGECVECVLSASD